MNFISQFIKNRFFATSLEKMNEQMYKTFQRFSLSELVEKYPTSKIIKIFTTDNPLVVSNYLGSIESLLYFVCSFFLGSIVILNIDWRIWVFLVVITCISFGVTKFFAEKIAQTQKRYNDSQEGIIHVLQDVFEQVAVMKIFGIGKRLSKRFHTENEEMSHHFFKNRHYQSVIEVVNDACLWSIQVGLLLIGFLLISRKELDFAELLAITQSVETITTPIFWLSDILTELYATKEIRKENDVLLFSKNTKNTQAESFEKITLENVSVNFQEKTIGELSSVMEKGKKYLITGKNGSGKSTLLKLLISEIASFEGDIKVDDVSLATNNLNGITGYVSQKVKLYKGSVEENIISFDKKNDDHLEKVGELCFGEKFEQLRSKQAQELSGGESMLTTIARALYSDRELLIVDEPTSAMDDENTQKILEILSKTNKTVVAVLHHLTEKDKQLFDEVIEMP
nr:ABC transporter ATP-binding protein [Pilibacter termitis]